MRLALVFALLLMSLPAAGNQFIQAYPAIYELARVDDSGREVLASGELLLRDGIPERVESGGDVGAMRPAGVPAEQPRVALHVMARRDRSGAARLDLESRVDIAVPRGSHRSEVAEREGSFIQGLQVTRVQFRSRTWQPLNDPTPIEVVHEEGGAQYVLTIMFRPTSRG
ncbi:hypothetical protein J2T57_002475 [Natronocella acetinitrilica]|uniref:Uncharacterized protein n=1 Tax=Natronocella acetinitrilica TaxID=414046 RepID=A0AAE3G7Q7_9GAMM|nr:hypothetical protein [Natronocella acetinitrilica]MCP1675327.1 hypothetical protein [Natronocella acetinitrilica]